MEDGSATEPAGAPAAAEPLPGLAEEPEALRQTARDVRMHLLVRTTLLHLLGGLTVFAYLQLRYPPSRTFDTPWVNDLAVLAGFAAVLFPVAWGLVLREFRRNVGWALVGRLPTAAERESLLVEPARMASRPFLFWLAATGVVVSGAGIRRSLSGIEVLDVAQIMVMGGLATCAISFLVIETTYRPLFAAALTGHPLHRPRSLGIRPRLLLAWAASSGVPLLGLFLLPLREAAASPTAIATLASVGMIAGAFATWIAATGIATPLGDVRRALRRVEDGDLGGDLLVDDGGEVGQVQAGFNQMVTGLRERRELQDLFRRHVGDEVAAQAIERGTDLGGEQRRASVIFVDLIGSTAMAEVLPPGEVVATLNVFFRAVVDVVTSEGGWVNKFEGDGALCVFGVPGFQPDHEERALRAARRLQSRLVDLSSANPGLEAGIGVSSGVVVAGNVGSEERFEYTVIGRAVNEAARLTELAKERPTRTLASAATVRAAGVERDAWDGRGTVGLRGQQRPTEVYEPRHVRGRAPSGVHPVLPPT